METAPVPSGRVDRRALAARWWGLAPVLGAAVIAGAATGRWGAALGAVAGIAAAVVVARHPVGATTLLITLVLFNLAGLALLYRIGVPAVVVRDLSYWKVAVVVGLGLRVLGDRPRRRPDLVEGAAIAYILLGVAYFVLPHLLVGGAAGAHLSAYERALGWRGDVFYVLAFVVARRLRLAPEVVDRLLRRFVSVAVVLAAFAVFEAAAPSLFNRLAVSVLGIPGYEHAVVGYQPSSAFSLHSVLVYSGPGDTGTLRVGSLLVDYLAVGFVFAIGLAIVGDRLARDVLAPRLWAALVVLASAAVLTETRSAIVAAVIAILASLRRRSGRPLWARAVLARVVVAGLLLAVPVTLAGGALLRFVHAPQSDAIHRQAFGDGLQSLEHEPLGNGLGTAEGGAQILLAGRGVSVVTEDQYLQIGAVMGIPGLVLYLVVVGGTARLLWRRSLLDAAELAPAAMSNAALGCFLGAVFTQPFTNLELSTALWVLLGLASGVIDRGGDARSATMSSPAGLPLAAVDR